MGVAARGCHHPDPDKGFGKVGGRGLPSAERGEESAAGRVLAAGSPGTTTGKEDPRRRTWEDIWCGFRASPVKIRVG